MAKEALNTKRISGLIIIATGLGIYYLRPASNCNWYNIFCAAGGLITSPIFFIIALVLILAGAIILIKG